MNVSMTEHGECIILFSVQYLQEHAFTPYLNVLDGNKWCSQCKIRSLCAKMALLNQAAQQLRLFSTYDIHNSPTMFQDLN